MITNNATYTLDRLETTLADIESRLAGLEKEKERLWVQIFESLSALNTDRVVLPNGMSLARVLQHRTSFNENVAVSILSSSLWPKITKRVIDPGLYAYEKDMGVITPAQDVQIRTVKESWVKRHGPATKEELRELKGAE